MPSPAQYLARREAGWCVVCGSQRAADGAVRCETCGEAARERCRAARARCVARRVCVTCETRRALSGQTRCQQCAEGHRRSYRELRAERGAG